MSNTMIRVILPTHLRRLASSERQVEIPVEQPVTIRSVLDSLENTYPMLRGTIRDQNTRERRAFIRFFACGQDYSHIPIDDPLPDSVAQGTEPFWVVGAMAGG
jgi:sulfur-carrier protein